MVRQERLFALGLLCASAVACTPAPPPGGNVTGCTPGSTMSCSCGDSGRGEATCNAGGTLYGDCVCGAPSTCDAGPEAACTCSDGGTGVAACLSDGGVGSCVCEGGTACTPGATMACACGNGSTGEETCNGTGTGYGQCVCGTACTPNAVTACTCGTGGPGEQTCNSSGTAYGACSCDPPPSCTASTLTASGSVTSGSGAINYTSTNVGGTFQHFLGTGSGCLGTATLELALETGSCGLQLQFGAVVDGSGGLTAATLTVDSGCSTLMGLAVGTYSSTAGYGLTSLQVTPAIPDAVLPTVCLSTATLQFGANGITLIDGSGSSVTINLGGLTVTGALYSTGSASATCYSTASCAPGYTESSQQWCTPMAGCGTGMHNGGTGTCVPDGTCSSGYHSDGTGTCVPAGQCATGYHNGGDGSCVPLGDCVTGDHDGGTGTCLPDGLCAAGYTITSTGTCISTCGTGEHDGGNGTCVPDGTCSSGYQNGGDGVCVPDGTCSAGYQDGGDGTCVPDGTCSAGYHNGGSGDCVLVGECDSGYMLGTSGVCVTESGCMLTGLPTANAGADQNASVGTSVTLNGDASTGDANPIESYTWSFQSVPTGSAAVLTGNGVTASFVPDIVGTYVVQLVVTDTGGCVSSASTTTVTVAACVAGLGWGWPIAPVGTPPPPMQGQSAVYDSGNAQLVVFGGQIDATAASPTFTNGTWALSLASGGTPTWTQLTPTGTLPTARNSHTAVFYPALHEMIVFGGVNSSGTALSDVWALALPVGGTPSWTELSPAGTAPAARLGHAAVIDEPNARMVVFGGCTGGSSTCAVVNDTWALSLPATGTPTWSALAPTGTLPAARVGHAVAYDAHFHEMVVFGGFDASSSWFNDAWTLSLATTGTPAWVELAPTGTAPAGLANPSVVYDTSNKELLVFGGWESSGADDAGLWSLSLPFTGTPAWSGVAASGTAPSARDSQSAVFIAALNAMILFGGEDYNVATGAYTYYDDTLMLGPITCP